MIGLTISCTPMWGEIFGWLGAWEDRVKPADVEASGPGRWQFR